MPTQDQRDSIEYDNIGCIDNDNRFEEVPDSVLNAAELLIDLCSSTSSTKVETLISIFRPKHFELNASREHVSSMAYRNKVASDVLQQNSLRVRFQSVQVDVDKNVSYTKNAVKVI